MGRKALFIYSRFIMLATTFLVAMFTIIGYYAGNSLPVNSLFTSALVFFMPFLYAMNIVLVFYWIFRRRWIFLAVPIITLIWTYGYIITLVNYHGEREVPEGTLSVATFNVRLFNQDNTGLQALDIKNMFLAEQVDVICFQEYNDHVDGEFGRVTANMQDAYPYVARGNNDMVILSKYPIVDKKNFPFEYSNNSYHWADIQVTKNNIVRVFNVHMETTGVNRTLRHAAKEAQAQGDTLDMVPITNNSLYGSLMGNYFFNLSVRSGQSIQVANEKLKSTHPIILCGDFNDVPYSFTYKTLLGDLVDGFCEAGSGFMFTYRGAKGIFRIDYIFHDPTMECVDYHILDKSYSDHNPVVSRIKLTKD